MSEPDLEAIRARKDAATPGPWKRWDDGVDNEVSARIGSIVEAPGRTADGRVKRIASVTDWLGGPQQRADAEFIAHARTDIPDLLEAVDRLRSMVMDAQTEAQMQAAEVERLRAENAEWEKLHDEAERLCARCGRELDR